LLLIVGVGLPSKEMPTAFFVMVFCLIMGLELPEIEIPDCQ
jgi:hypothetical protein